MEEIKEEVVKKERQKTMSKPEFMAAYVPFMKSLGVVFVDENGKTTQNKQKYWELFVNSQKFITAAAASSGTSLSLSGVGIFAFKPAGRKEETRCLRYKAKTSSAIQNFYTSNQDLVVDGKVPTEEEFVANVNKILEALCETKAVAPAPVAEVIEATDEPEPEVNPVIDEAPAEVIADPIEETVEEPDAFGDL